MSDLVVAGATGFLGRHLMSKAASEGLPVLPVVRSRERAQAENLENFLVLPEITGRESELSSLKSPCLVHLIGSTRDERDSSVWNSNVATTQKLISIARYAGIRRIIYLSGYGITDQSSEPYFQAKAEAENLIRASQIPYTIFRCSYILGLGDELIPTLIEQLEGGRIEIPGSGSYRIQPVHVDDVVSVIMKAANDESLDSFTFDLLGQPVAYVDFVRNLCSKIAPTAEVVTVDMEIVIRRAIFSPDPFLTLSELAVLICDRVGDPTPRCLGVEMRDSESIFDEISSSYFRNGSI